MWKYIVTWVVIKTYFIACPYSPPVPDEYGRVPDLRVEKTVACYAYDTTAMMRDFISREDAIWFSKRGSIECRKGISLSWCEGWKIDSIKVKGNYGK